MTSIAAKPLTKSMALLLALIILLPSCATQTQTGAAVGAGAGAVTGGIVGGLLGGRQGAAIGILAGGLVGAGVGALVGNHLDKQVADRATAARRADYSPTQGTRVEIQRSDLSPVPAAPGTTVVSKVEYSVLAPNPGATVPVTEVRSIQKDGQIVMGPEQRQVSKPQGVHVSEYQFKVPSGTPAGQYTMLTVLDVGQGPGAQRQTAQSALTIATP
jgi:outer membrane lipoprotein SlyB